MTSPPQVQLSPASRRALLNGIVIDNPRARIAHAEFDYLCELASLCPGQPTRCVSLIAPSQTGKTTIIDTYVKRLNTAEALRAGEIPALKVTLRASVTRRQFAQDILEAVEGFGYNALTDKGTEYQLLRRVSSCLLSRKVKLLFLDEFHHLVHSDNQRVVWPVSEMVKHLLNEGNCPIVVAGLEGARKPFDGNVQLAHRAQCHVDLHPLEPTSRADMELFVRFLASFLAKAEQIGALAEPAALLDDKAPHCILEISRGVLGAACNLIKDAVHMAALDGRMNVTSDDLTAAGDRAVRNRLCDRNPFREGLAPIRRLKEAA